MHIQNDIELCYAMFLKYCRGYTHPEIIEYAKKEFDIDVSESNLCKIIEKQEWVKEKEEKIVKDKEMFEQEMRSQLKKEIKKKFKLKDMIDELIYTRFADLELNREEIKGMKFKDLLDYIKLSNALDGGVNDRTESKKEITISVGEELLRRRKEKEEKKKEVEVPKNRLKDIL